jgi:hypothetical protein|tara:strand:+ start:115 stop:339 length:225 start_codon:yes stop_codon:yes gene_type:complete
MLVYYGQPLQLFDKKDGMMYEVRVLLKDGEPYIDLTTVYLDQDGEIDLTACIYGLSLKELTGTDRYETSDFNQK